jgi:glycine cleavage system regulatory protein
MNPVNLKQNTDNSTVQITITLTMDQFNNLYKTPVKIEEDKIVIINVAETEMSKEKNTVTVAYVPTANNDKNHIINQNTLLNALNIVGEVRKQIEKTISDS